MLLFVRLCRHRSQGVRHCRMPRYPARALHVWRLLRPSCFAGAVLFPPLRHARGAAASAAADTPLAGRRAGLSAPHGPHGVRSGRRLCDPHNRWSGLRPRHRPHSEPTRSEPRPGCLGRGAAGAAAAAARAGPTAGTSCAGATSCQGVPQCVLPFLMLLGSLCRGNASVACYAVSCRAAEADAPQTQRCCALPPLPPSLEPNLLPPSHTCRLHSPWSGSGC